MPQNNRLEIILTAKREGLTRGLRAAEQDAKRAGAGISKSIEAGGEGADRLGKVIDNVAGSFGKVSKEAGDSFKDVSAAADKAGARTSDAFDGTESDIQGLARHLIGLQKAFDKTGAEGSEAFAKLQDDVGKLEGKLQGLGSVAKSVDLGNALGAGKELLADFGQLGKVFSDAGNAAREMERRIDRAIEDPKKAKQTIANIRKLKDELGDAVTFEGLGTGAQRLETLSALTEKNLGRIARVAVATGRDVDDVADDVGEFLAAFESGNFDAGVLDALRSKLGISAKALGDHGAALDSNNELLVVTEEQQRKAQKALIDFIDTNKRFADVSKRGTDNLSKLRAETEKFTDSVGQQVNEVKDFAAGLAAPIVELANEAPASFKKFLGVSALAASGVGEIGLKLGQAAAIAKLAGVDIGSLGGKLKALRLSSIATSAGAAGLAYGALAVAIVATTKATVDYTKAVVDAEKAEQNLLATQDKAFRDNDLAAFRRKSVAALKEEAAAIDDLAKRRVFLTKAVLEARDAYDKAEREGGDTKAAQQRLIQLEAERKALDAARGREVYLEQQVEKATVKRYEKAREAFLEFQKAQSRGEFDSKKQELSILDSIIGQLDGDALKEAQGKAREIRAALLQTEVAGVTERIQAQKLGAKEAKAILADLLTTYRANADQRAAIEKSVNAAIISVEEATASRRRQLLADNLALKKEALKLDAGRDDGTLQKLEAQLDAGEDILQVAKTEATEQAKKLILLAEEEASLERIRIKREETAQIKADPGNADVIRENTELKLQALQKQTADKKADLEQANAKKLESLEDRAAKGQQKRQKEALAFEQRRLELAKATLDEEQAGTEEVFSRRRELLEEQAAFGRDVSAELKKLAKDEAGQAEADIKARLKLRQDEIKLKQDLADVGATQQQKSLNEQQANLANLQAQRQARQDLQAVYDQDLTKLQGQTAELRKQLKLLEDQGAEKKKQQGFDTQLGTVSGVGQLNENTGGFGVSRRDREATSGKRDSNGRTEAELRAQISRNEGILNSQRNAQRQRLEGLGSTGTGNAGPSFGELRNAELNAQHAAAQSGAGLSGGTLERILGVLEQQNTLIQQQQSDQVNAPVNPSGFGFSSARGLPGYR